VRGKYVGLGPIWDCIQLHFSLMILNSWSVVIRILILLWDRCSADKYIFHCRLFVSGFPFLFIKVTAVMLPIFNCMAVLYICFAKHWTSRKAASSSRKLMCFENSYLLLIWTSFWQAPQLTLDTLVSGMQVNRGRPSWSDDPRKSTKTSPSLLI